MKAFIDYVRFRTVAKACAMRRVAAVKALARVKDAQAFATAMVTYHRMQLAHLGDEASRSELLQVQLDLLEAEEGRDYAEALLSYYTKRIASLDRQLAPVNTPV